MAAMSTFVAGAPNPSYAGRLFQAKVRIADEALSTLGGGQGVVAFYGMAKPVKTPMIGPPRAP